MPEKDEVEDANPLKKEKITPTFVHFKHMNPLLLRLCRPWEVT